MKLTVQEAAAAWYKEELELTNNTSLRFFVRYGGVCGLQPGFSLGIRPDTPQEPIMETTVKGIHFYVEEEDSWYFDHHDVQVYYDDDKKEPNFEYIDSTQ